MNTSIANELWDSHGSHVETFICAKVCGESHCGDILHDVFLKITENEERIKLVQNPASYIIKMAHNAIIDYYRSQKRIVSVNNKIEPQIANENSEMSKLADCCLTDFINKLPSIYSQALILTELEGISQKDLAVRLNMSYTGAKSRVQRARLMLKDSILACCPYQFDKYGNIVGCCR